MKPNAGLAIIVLTVALRTAAASPFDTTADAVLGQGDFVANVPNAPDGLPTAANLSLSNAAHCALAPDGRFYVSDANNNRVLSWPSAAAFTNGAPADMVIGQPDFASSAPNNGGVSASSLSLPQGVWVEESGHLWVTDAFNSRVLRFNNPATDATPFVADLVVGQPDFTHNDQNLGNGKQGTHDALPNGLQFPGRVLARGPDLYIADSGNSRVIHYAYPASSFPSADRVWGQFGDLTCRSENNDGFGNFGCCPSADNLRNPIGLALTGDGRLYIADWGNHRILRYDNPLGVDTTADAVLGQPGFVSGMEDNGGPLTGLHFPFDICLDPIGRLFIADSSNSRVVVHSDPTTGILPDLTLGQLGSLTAEDANHGLGFFITDADGLFSPSGIISDASRNLYVVDTNNNRVLRFDAALLRPGDLNCDAVVDLMDVSAFALAVVDGPAHAAAFPGCDGLNADVNGDGQVDGGDVAAFVDVLLGT